MASKNSVKQYVENGYYHLYNRGVEKRKIFQDKQDYAVFLDYLKTYLMPKDTEELNKRLMDENTSPQEKAHALKLLKMNNFYDEIHLISYCLMPNHFHFLVKQKSLNAIDGFINSLFTRYVMYFNRKYKRVGPLFQDVYKAVLVVSEPQLLYLTGYIHRNPKKLALKGGPFQTQPSSYADYLGQRNTDWIKCKEILSFFSSTNPVLSYQSFVEQTSDFSHINDLLLEEDDF